MISVQISSQIPADRGLPLSFICAEVERPQFSRKRRPLPPKHSVHELFNIMEELEIIKAEDLHGTVKILTTPVEPEQFRASFLELVNCDRFMNGSTAWSS